LRASLTGWGKTRLGAALCIATALRGGTAWWVAPSYKTAAAGWRIIRWLARQIDGVEIRLGDRMVTMPGGGWVQVRSADDPDSLRGEGLDLVVLDECAFMRESAWTESLRPSLSDREGKALFISTPKGRNWFFYRWQAGNLGEDEWASWNFPTGDNPYINPAEIEKAKAGLPDRIFRQEYLAEFIDDAGGVFRGVVQAMTATEQTKAIAEHGYIFGVDWGKSADFTVITVVDAKLRAVVAMDRFNQIDYSLQRARLGVLYEQFQPEQIIAESNSMGEPIIEQLRQDGLPVVPFLTTNASKTQAIEALALAIERQDISLIPDETLIAELQAYEAKRLPSGLLRYTAPEGMHDDCVMSLALAWQAIARPQPRYIAFL